MCETDYRASMHTASMKYSGHKINWELISWLFLRGLGWLLDVLVTISDKGINLPLIRECLWGHI